MQYLKNKVLIFLLLLACASIGAATDFNKVGAISAYDDLIDVPANLYVDGQDSSVTNISTNYMDYIDGTIDDEDFSGSDCDGTCQLIITHNLANNGGIAVLQEFVASTDTFSAVIYICEQPLLGNNYSSYNFLSYTIRDLASDSVSSGVCTALRIERISDDIHVSLISNSATTVGIASDTRVTSSNALVNSLQPFVYKGAFPTDPDYEGEIPPTTGPGEGVTTDYVPDWEVTTMYDYKGTFVDKNFATFDGIEWTCSEDGNSLIEGGEGFAPVLYWQIWRDSDDPEVGNVMLDDGYQSATGVIEYQFPHLAEDREYRIVGWYECGGTVDFTDAANFTFTVNKYGQEAVTLMEDCFTEEFPFINMDACINNLLIPINMLSFNTIAFGNTWDYASSCYDLVIMDDWLGLQDPTVCPEVPSEVRNIVTPFVTMILGLIMISFIANNRGTYW